MDADRIKGTARTSYGRAKSDIGAVAGDEGLRLDGLGDEIAGRAQTSFGQAKDEVRDALDRAAGLAEDAYGESRRRVLAGADAINAQVESNPVMAILVACAAGYLLGLAVRLGRRR